jgi:hypothetical protein
VLSAQTGHSRAYTMLRRSPSERPFVHRAAFCWMKRRSADKVNFRFNCTHGCFQPLLAVRRGALPSLCCRPKGLKAGFHSNYDSNARWRRERMFLCN